MKILCVCNGGFGDVSWCTSWPRIWSEQGHEVDIFLMKYTGNPFHANQFARKVYIEERGAAYKKIIPLLDNENYDVVLIPDNSNDGVREVIEATKNRKNVHLFRGSPVVTQAVAGIEIPKITKPEWSFTKEEAQYVEESGLKGAILLHPLASSVYEETKNIDFDLVVQCNKRLENMAVLYGGSPHVPVAGIKKMESAGVRLLWEGHNNIGQNGCMLGVFFALTSQCKASIHAWSGSFTLPMGFNKPYVMVVPGDKLKVHTSYQSSREWYEKGIHRARLHGCLVPSAWCITKDPDVIAEAVQLVCDGKVVIYDKGWEIL